MYLLKEHPASWEIVAAMQVIQAQGQSIPNDGIYDSLYAACGANACIHSDAVDLSFAPALRAMGTRVDPYWRILAETTGKDTPDTPLTLDIVTSDEQKILLCPYGPDQSLNLNMNVWKYITKSLRSYGLPVMMIGDEGQRMDSSAFLENDTLSSLPFAEKIQHIASATLVVGVPNAWIWLAAAMGKKTIVFYPDVQPPKRWLWQTGEHILCLMHQYNKVQIPVLLTGLRRAIDAL